MTPKGEYVITILSLSL